MKVQKRINTIQSLAVASSVYRKRNQYRIYASNGTGLIMTLIEGHKGVRLGFSEFEYPDNVACAWDGEDANGTDVVFFGTDDGKVSLERAQLQGMSDFLTVPVSHPLLMRDAEVKRQVVYFLDNGRFDHGDSQRP